MEPHIETADPVKRDGGSVDENVVATDHYLNPKSTATAFATAIVSRRFHLPPLRSSRHLRTRKHRREDGMRQLELFDSPDVASPALACLPGASKREEDDDYHQVAVVLNEKWRVVVCRDCLQWILQRRAGTRDSKARWTGKGFFRTREGLLRRAQIVVGAQDAKALGALPLRIETQGAVEVQSVPDASLLPKLESGRRGVR